MGVVSRRVSVLTGIVWALLGVLGGDVMADEAATEIRVAADRFASDPFDKPRVSERLDGEEIRLRRAARTVPEILSESVGVSVQETARGHGSPYIRGMTGVHNLVLIDGVRLNSSVYRYGPIQYWNTVDPFILAELELVGGPSSVAWGSDALGGTLHLSTREPSFELEPLWAHGRVYGRFASADRSSTGRVEIDACQGPVGVIGGFTYSDSDDLVAGRHTGRLANTGYSRRDGDLKLVGRLAEGLELVAAYQGALLRNVPRTHKTVFSVPYRTTTVGSELRRDTDQERHLAYLQLRHQGGDEDLLRRLHASVAFHVQREDFVRLRTSTRWSFQGWESRMFSTFVQAESFIRDGLVLSYGADYSLESVDSYSRAVSPTSFTLSPRGPVADEAQVDQLGAFLLARYEPLDWLELQAGVRYQLTHLHARDVDPDPSDAFPFGMLRETYDAVVASGRILVAPMPELRLFAGVSQGFRAPNLDDTTSFDEVRTSSLDTPSPDVKPERTISYELGGRFRQSVFPFIEAEAAVYWTDLRKFIQRVPTGRTIGGLQEFRKDNFSDGFIYGVETRGSVQLHPDLALTLFGGFAFTEGTGDALQNNVRVDDALSRMPPAKGLVGLRWENDEGWLWVEGLATIVRHQHRLSMGDQRDTDRIPYGGTPGHTLLTVRSGVTFEEPDLRASISVENLLDRSYRVHGSGQNGPGTNAILAVELGY